MSHYELTYGDPANNETKVVSDVAAHDTAPHE
jgi:hypothetical protein